MYAVRRVGLSLHLSSGRVGGTPPDAHLARRKVSVLDVTMGVTPVEEDKMSTDAREPDDGDADSDRTLLSAVEPAPPGYDLAAKVDAMEDRVLHGTPEKAQEEKEQTDAEEEAPEPEDVDPSGGAPA